MLPRDRINTPTVVHEIVDGEVIAIDLQRGHYFSLLDTAVEAWAMLATGVTVADAAAALVRWCDGAPADVERALGGFMIRAEDRRD